jgi:two-component system chemotaxis response regulator CheY
MGGYNMATILIVEDSKFLRMTIKKMCQDASHQVIGEANDGQEGIELYFRLKPDLVTMDITMPVMNGIDAVKEICSKDSNARIIICSAMGQQLMVMKAISYGAKDFVVKPFDSDRFNNAIAKALKS